MRRRALPKSSSKINLQQKIYVIEVSVFVQRVFLRNIPHACVYGDTSIFDGLVTFWRNISLFKLAPCIWVETLISSVSFFHISSFLRYSFLQHKQSTNVNRERNWVKLKHFGRYWKWWWEQSTYSVLASLTIFSNIARFETRLICTRKNRVPPGQGLYESQEHVCNFIFQLQQRFTKGFEPVCWTMMWHK